MKGGRTYAEPGALPGDMNSWNDCRMGTSDSFKDRCNKITDSRLVVGIGLSVEAVGDNRANGHGLVSHQLTKALERGAFHLVVSDLPAIVFKSLYAAVEVGIGKRQTELAALGAIEAYGRDSISAHHVAAADALDEFGIGVDNVWLRPQRVPACVLAEILLKIEVGHFVASGIVVEDTVEADGFLGDNRCAKAEFGLESTGCADAHEGEHTLIVADLAGLEVYVGESVEFVDHNVDVVGSDAMAKTHDGLAFVCAAYRVEFAGRDLECTCVEKLGHHVDTARVSDEDHTVRELRRQKMQVEYTAVGIDYKFRFGDYFFAHIKCILWK